jgi:hypothetical protein
MTNKLCQANFIPDMTRMLAQHQKQSSTKISCAVLTKQPTGVEPVILAHAIVGITLLVAARQAANVLTNVVNDDPQVTD